MNKSYLQRLVDGDSLSRADARDAMRGIMDGEATDAQIAGFLVGLRVKGETVDEIAGFAEAMRDASRRVDLGRAGLVDTCGTGGDGAGTFNVSTAAALVAAGAGVPIAKHGNRAVSSSCGSADVLEALGVRLVHDEGALRRCLDDAGIAFLFAPAQHPAMKHAVGPRRDLGLRTVFNVLGPLTNPAGARLQVIGVYSQDLVAPVAEVLGRLGAERAWVVHGAGGLDELSTLGDSVAAIWDGGRVRHETIDPGQVGIDIGRPEDVAGGSVAANAAIVERVLNGEAGPPRDLIVLNAGAAIHVGGRADDLGEGVEAAQRSIDSGAARAALDNLVRATEERPS